MLLSLPDLIKEYSLDIRGVIHVGAHFGEEYQAYADSGIREMVFFEPVRASFEELQKRLNGKEVQLVNKAVGNQNTSIEMYTETSTLSPTRTRSRMYQAPYGVQRSIASHAPLVRTESQTTVSTALSRCSRPTADTGIIVSNTASEANACAYR